MQRPNAVDEELVERVVTHKFFTYTDADGYTVHAQVGDTIKVKRSTAKAFPARLVDPKVTKAVEAAAKAVEESNKAPDPPKPPVPSAKAPTPGGPSQ